MFILNYIPTWLLFIVLMIGLFGWVVKEFETYRPIAVGLIFASLFLIGFKTADKIWQDRVTELEKRVAELGAKKEIVNTKIVTKVLTKEKIVKEAAEVQIQYVDREVVKYNDQCKIPPEVITIHNKAVKQ
jgi:hypothetical protein